MATVAMAFLRERALLHRTLSPLCSDQQRLHRTPKIEFRQSDDDHIPEVASLHQIGQYIEAKPINFVEEKFETEVSSNSRVVGSNPFKSKATTKNRPLNIITVCVSQCHLCPARVPCQPPGHRLGDKKHDLVRHVKDLMARLPS